MIQPCIQTSSSNMIPIKDFRYLCELARCSKCQMFIFLRATNKLYGTRDDCSSIHEIDVPFLVNTDIVFRLDSIPKSVFDEERDYFVPSKFNWIILPDYEWEMYNGGDIISAYDEDSDRYDLVDKTTNKVLQSQIHMYKTRPSEDNAFKSFITQLNGLLYRIPNLQNPISFTNMQNNESIREALDNKAAMGTTICKLKYADTNIIFYFYKGLVSLAKSDTLDLDIRFDKFDSRLFMATFRPHKKKNPIAFNMYGAVFQEKIHCMFINMS